MAMAVQSEKNVQLREETLSAVKKHKASWIRLGQYLFSIHKQKLFKDWGFMSFDGYCMKELRLRQATASKLLKSYSFLEKEEPRYVQEASLDEETPQKLPDYETVNLLRLAKENKSLTPHDVAEVRDSVFERGKEAKEVRKQVKELLEARENRDPEEVKVQKRNTVVRRMISLLKSAKRDFEKEKLLPVYLLKQMNDLAQKLEDQLA